MRRTIPASTRAAGRGSLRGAILATVTLLVVGGCDDSTPGASQALVSLDVTPAMASIAAGTTQRFVATGTYGDGSQQDLTFGVAWSSSEEAVAQISAEQGLATGLSEGSTTITARVGDIGGSTTLTVTPAVLVSLAISPSHADLAIGTTVTLSAIGTFSDGTQQDLTTSAQWTSSAPQTAVVSDEAASRGLVTGLAEGNASLTAAVGSVMGTATVTVTSAVLASITVIPVAASLAVGAEVQFNATGTFSDGTQQDITTIVVWSSSDSSRATVSNEAGHQGLVVGIAEGEVTISATRGEVTSLGTLLVGPAQLLALTVSPEAASVPEGMSVQLTATGSYTDRSERPLTALATWTSADVRVAVVAPGEAGLVFGTHEGETIVTASYEGVGDSSVLTVAPAILTAIDVTPATLDIAAGTTGRFGALGTFSNDDELDLTASVVWSCSDPAVAEPNGESGQLLGLAEGSASISATMDGVTGSAALGVTAAQLAAIEISPSGMSIPNGVTVDLTATGIFTDASRQDVTSVVSWQSSDTDKATISNEPATAGRVTTTGVGTVEISATMASVTATMELTVSDAVLATITVTPPSAIIGVGATYAFTATGTYTDASTQNLTASAVWSSSDPLVAFANAGVPGTGSGLANGLATITAAIGIVAGSATIEVRSATGAGCAAAGDCASGHCVDGVCCNSACSGTCERCDHGGSVGTCASSYPDDPDQECGLYYCRAPLWEFNPGCDTICASIAISGTAWRNPCKPGSYCDTSGCSVFDCVAYCVPLRANGSSCSADEQCTSGVCADGICQCGVCQRYNTTTHSCENVSGDPFGKCYPYNCDGAGSCYTSCSDEGYNCSSRCSGWCWGSTCLAKLAGGQGCIGNCQCQSGYCGFPWVCY